MRPEGRSGIGGVWVQGHIGCIGGEGGVGFVRARRSPNRGSVWMLGPRGMPNPRRPDRPWKWTAIRPMLGRNRTESNTTSAKVAQLGAKIRLIASRSGPKSTGTRPNSAKCWPTSARFGPKMTKLARCSIKLGRIRSYFGEADRIWTDSDQTSLLSLTSGPTLTQFGRKLGPTSTKVGPMIQWAAAIQWKAAIPWTAAISWAVAIPWAPVFFLENSVGGQAKM